MTPDPLPFEYPFRWRNEDLATMAGVTPEAAALLEQRDRDLEDFLASLPTESGAASEAFTIYGSGTITAGEYGVPDLSDPIPTSAYYMTSGVTIGAIGSYDAVSIPAGVWVFEIVAYVYQDSLSAPSTGDFTIEIDPQGPLDRTAQMLPSEVGGTAIHFPGVGFSQQRYLADTTLLSPACRNGFDEDVYVDLAFSGVQIPTKTLTIGS